MLLIESIVGNTCGTKWYINGSDGTSGLGQQLSAMEVMYALLVNETAPPMTEGNVSIRSEPPVATSLRPLPPPPSATARPLYGSKNAANPLSWTLLPLGVELAKVALFAMAM